MGGKNVIDDFRGDYRWLSNFHLIDLEYEGLLYPSSEHAYQAAKTLNMNEKRSIQKLEKCMDAKKAGMHVTLRKNWEHVKLSVMFGILWIKFQVPELKQKLIATGTSKLIEGNTWNDFYWGMCNGKGENHLGRILMQIRTKLQEEDHGA